MGGVMNMMSGGSGDTMNVMGGLSGDEKATIHGNEGKEDEANDEDKLTTSSKDC